MKTILHLFKGSAAIFILLFTWLGIMIPNLKIYWMLVDDGFDVVFSRTLFERLFSFNITNIISKLLEDGGRFRPVYWIYQITEWLIGGNNYQIHHFVHMMVIGLTLLFIYLILKELTKSKLISFFGAMTYLLIPTNSENIYRLGPQEPLLVLFLSAFFYLLIKGKKIFLPCLILFLSVFIKETSVALVPILFFYFFYGRNNKLIKNKKQGFYIWITICVSAVAMILISFLRRSGYSTNYYFNIPIFIENFLFYLRVLSRNTLFTFPILLMIYLFRNITLLVKKKRIIATKMDLFEFIFILGFSCFLLLQLPWKYALDRYLMPVAFFLIIFLFLEIYQDLVMLSKIIFVKNHKRILIFTSTVIGIYVCFIWGFQLFSREVSYPSYYDVFAKMASLPKNTILLMNMHKGEATVELVEEVQIQLSEFWKRGDIKAEYLDLSNLPKDNYVIVDSGNFPRGYSADKLVPMCNKGSDNVNNVTKSIVITTPLELVKQSFKKLVNLLLHKKPFTSEGLYTYSYSYNNWLICYK